MFLQIFNLLVSLFAILTKMAKNKTNKRKKDINNNNKRRKVESMVELDSKIFMKPCSVVLTRLENLPIAKKTNKILKNKLKTQNKDQSCAIHKMVSILKEIFSLNHY